MCGEAIVPIDVPGLMRIDRTMVGYGSYDITRVDQPSSLNSTPSIKILDLSMTMPKERGTNTTPIKTNCIQLAPTDSQGGGVLDVR